MEKNKIKKILLINFGGIGDEILFFPTIKSIKQTYPKAKIYLALEERSKSAKHLCSGIDNVFCVNIKSKFKYFSILKFLLKVWFKGFDIVFSTGSSKLVSILLFLTGIKERYGFYSGTLSEKLLTKTAILNQNQYAANMYHDLAKLVNPDIECYIPEIDEVETPEVLGDKPIILLHPGVSQMSIDKNIIKGWDTKRWAKLIDMLLDTKKYKVFLAGGKDDNETINKILFLLNATRTDFSDFQNMYGKTKSIKDFISLIKISSLMVCVDSAPLHMAIATNTPVVTIFGPTNEKVLVPQRDNIVVIKNENIDCRPCLWEKRQTSCETKECLEVHTQDVFNAVERMLAK